MCSIYLLAGLALLLVGTIVTIAFWIPKLINRPLLKQTLGKKYFLVYLVYSANGPLLIILGLFLIFGFH